MNKRKMLLTQLSMRETTREAKWERRRRQVHERRRRMMEKEGGGAAQEEPEEEEEERRRRSLTEEDLDELRGSIELGFGFNEEDGGHGRLRDTLPALDLYFAVNRLRPSPASSLPCSDPGGAPSPRSPCDRDRRRSSNASDPWKICSPGDNPEHVKVRLRQWAQLVACSVRQSC